MPIISQTGASDILNLIKAPLSRGVEVSILVNKYEILHPAAQAMIRSYAKTSHNFKLYDFTHPDGCDLHAKFIFVGRERVLIGSSNISRRGFLENHELAVTLEGPECYKIF
ncbi:phospholipase D family protein [Paenibacillus taichungensis]|uniref:phospholipase D family protein n=1 Tax=Paenibacillus taichungensis TaxID=484184 RepID=UPI0035C69109